MSNEEPAALFLDFRLRPSFGIRHSCFVIFSDLAPVTATLLLTG
jgi:hypothetical protein